MPAYNGSTVIGSALRSALNQTLSDIEVLVVDDGSTDDTADIVRQAAKDDPRIRLIEQENAGVAAARNAAIAAARGTYIAPLDADDLWYRDKLAAQVARAEAGGPEMGMVYSWWVRIDERDVIHASSFPCGLEGDLALPLFYVNFIGNASVPLFRRDIVERVGGYDEGLRAQGAQGCEDWDLSLRVAARFKSGVAPGYHVGYRQVPDSMSSLVDTMSRSYYAVVDRVREEWSGVPADVFRWSAANFELYLAAQSYGAGQFGSAFRWAASALRRDPGLALSPYIFGVLAKSALFASGGRPLYDAVRQDRHAEQYTMAEVEAQWTGADFDAPWRDTWKPFSRLRSLRWKRVGAAKVRVRKPTIRETHPVIFDV